MGSEDKASLARFAEKTVHRDEPESEDLPAKERISPSSVLKKDMSR